MDQTAPAELTADERDAFLGAHGSGVISFATEEADVPPHSIPVSYGYNPAETTFFFRLAVGADRAKGELSERAVSFVVYDTTDEGWWSVSASGRLESTTEASIATDALAGMEGIEIPLVDIFGDQPANVSFEFFRLVPESLTTRKESSTEL
jgi:nitroimidazol reductase NimA-like FMN-containing flavoprotein (pyridoxamine 5'-phosphate oxidase superfamily)